MGRRNNNFVNVGVGFLIIILVFGVWQFFSWEKKSNNEYVYNQLQTWIDKQEKVVAKYNTEKINHQGLYVRVDEENYLNTDEEVYNDILYKVRDLKDISQDMAGHIAFECRQHTGSYMNFAKYAQEYLDKLRDESRIALENNDSKYFKDIQYMLDRAEKK